MQVLQHTRTRLVCTSPTSWQRILAEALARFLLTGAVLGIFYFSIVSRLINEGQQTRLTCHRPYPRHIDCELIQADEEGASVTTKIFGLQSAQIVASPVATNGSLYAHCRVMLYSYGGESSVTLSEEIATGGQQCTQAQQFQRRVNTFVNDRTLRLLTLEEDNRHEPLPTWWVAGFIWGATSLSVALVPLCFVRTHTWVFDRTSQCLSVQHRWLWFTQRAAYPFTSIDSIQVLEDNDRWQRPRYALQLALQDAVPMMIVAKDYGPQHYNYCQDLSSKIHDLITQKC